jgi:hypothetical protein
MALADGGNALPKALAALTAARNVGVRPAVLEGLLLVADALRAAGAGADADRILASVATEGGPTAVAARERLSGRTAEPAGDVDALTAALELCSSHWPGRPSRFGHASPATLRREGRSPWPRS